MEILKGKNSGFCFGVKRAMDEAEKLIASGTKAFVLGEIIHNETVVENLKSRGIITINDIDDERLSIGDILIIRTHGEPKKIFERAKERGLKIIDCTCPFVKAIQEKAEDYHKKGYKIVIIGRPEHPEVKGINGWCDDDALITENAEDVINLKADKICVVVQTTYSEEKFDKIVQNFAADRSKTLDIFKTICYTTIKRQKEADTISKECPAVIVLGGTNSNNTQKLYEICHNNCDNVFRISKPSDFDFDKIKKFKRIGIVFGASTPIEQFQEVISIMENNNTEEIIVKDTAETATEETAPAAETVENNVAAEPAAENNAEVKEESAKSSDKKQMLAAFNNIKRNPDFRLGQIVKATVSSVNANGLTVSLKDSKKDVDVAKEELLNELNEENYKAEQAVRLMVVGKNPLRLSEKAMKKVLEEEAEITEIKQGKIFDCVITATNKGGLIGKYLSYEVFVPASQVKIGFVKDLEKYVGKTLRLRAEKVESKSARRQIVGSQKVILVEEKEERDAIKAAKEAEFFGNIIEGDVVLGTPVRFAAFGAFVDVNGFDCLAHISDLSWTGCNDCSEVLELGKQYEFKILKIDAENKRVSIGYKQLQPKPWDTVFERYNIGDVISGKVVRIVSFGAFVEVEKGIDGLIHVSQISDKWLENPVTALQVGQEVQAKILNIDPENEKMTLSIKALMAEQNPVETEEAPKKGKKRADKSVEDDGELREWKDDNNGGASISELLNQDK